MRPGPVGRLLVRRFDRVLAVSHYMAGAMAAAGVPESIIETVHDGIDLDAFTAQVKRAPDAMRAELGVSEDAVLALLSFTSRVAQCTPDIGFRDHLPPTTFTDALGNPVVPNLVRRVDSCLGDVNCDGEVDVEDLTQVILEWGLCEEIPPEKCAADINGDGAVTVVDLSLLITNWGPCP